ncbi:MAG: prepilin-type N-terminal cleavage/methylation domain-containing protein [Nitrospirae bacterium]|nr:prepilin-type N-terminal cleavage/methylation domain-containing protein [Nitrospirota bacterium]
MNKKGFTFLEILIVLAIIGILSALAVSDISAFTDRLYLQSFARQISTDLREMKMRSVIERQSYTVNFDSANNFYNITGRIINLPPGIRFGFSAGVLGPPANPVETPEADGVTFPSNKITFHPQGSNSLGTIYITNDRNETRALSLTITGRVKIWRWDGERWL